MDGSFRTRVSHWAAAVAFALALNPAILAQENGSGSAPAAPAATEGTTPPAAEPKAEESQDSLWSLETGLLLRYWSVDGDENRFRQNHQMTDGFSGGIRSSRFSFKRDDGLLFYGEARVDVPDDYLLHAQVRKEGGGWAKLEIDATRYYFDGQFMDTSGFPSMGGVVPEANRPDPGSMEVDHLDIGIEVGIAFEDFPKIWVGYERREEQGDKSTWIHGIRVDPTNTVEFGAFPNPIETDYDFQRIYAGISHQIGSWSVIATPSYQITRGDQSITTQFFNAAGTLLNRRFDKEIYDHDTFAVDVRAHGPIVTDKLDLDVGYNYAFTRNQNTAEVDTRTPAGAPSLTEKGLRLLNPEHNGDAYMHRFHMELTFEASDDFTVWAGAQFRSGQADSDAIRREDGSEEVDNNGPLVPDETWNYTTVNDESGFAESVGVEIRAIPKTKVTLKGEFEQIDVDYDWNADIEYNFAGAGADDLGDWTWNDTGHYDQYGFSMNATTRCTEWIESNLRYRYISRDVDHDEDVDVAEAKPGDPDYTVPAANVRFYYPGTIGDTDRDTHEVKFSLKMDPYEWLTVTPRYGFTWTELSRSDAVREDQISSTQYILYGLNLQLMPVDQLTLVSDAYFVDGQTWTGATRITNSLRRDPNTGLFNNGWLGGQPEEQRHNYLNISQAVNWNVDAWTFNLSYAYMRQVSWWRSYTHSGLAKIEYKLSDSCSVDANFGYETFDEDQNEGINDYDAFLAGMGFKAKF